jgi:hypothetical protein
MEKVFFDNDTIKEKSIFVGLVLLYLLLVSLFIGLRNDHLILVIVILISYFANPISKKILLSIIFFILYWVIYDATRIYPNFEFNPVNIQEPYEIEKALFGISGSEGILTPNEYFALHTNAVLDFLTGLFYLTWVPVPLIYGIWLYFKDKKLLLQFSVAFFIVNVFGFIIYYLYPAAPPWYVALYGFEQNFNIPGNAAGLANFDKLFGIDLFHNMYSRNANVFAAIPSMHSAFPALALYYAWKKGSKFWIGLFIFVGSGIWFGAVYSNHHYIIDVILGISCSVFAILVFELLRKNDLIQKWLARYEKVIS